MDEGTLACAFRKYLEEKWRAPIIRKMCPRVPGVLRSVGGISPIGVFLAMCLQWLLHDTFKALPAKAAFAKVFNKKKAKDIWSTTTLDAMGDG
jgi:hypothetical protein